MTGESVSQEIVVSIVEPARNISGTLNFTNSSQMKVQEPSENELKINNSDSNSTKIQDIKMYHKFGTGELSLGNNLSQKLPGENWEKQEIDPKQPLNISIKELNMGDEYAAKYDIMLLKPFL